MKKIKIGIPRGLNYYRDHVLWESFFKNLDLDIVKSPFTTKVTIDNGSKYLVDEACVSLKIFMGHVSYLKGKCDYVLVPRINSLKKGQQVCTNFTALYDLCKNLFSDINFITYNVDVSKGYKQYDSFLKMGKKLGFKKKDIKKAYDIAYLDTKKHYEKKLKDFKEKLNSEKIKILLVGHPYNIKDNYIGGPIINYLKKEGCEVLLSDIYNANYNEEDANFISKKIYWTYNRELFSVISKYKDKIDGIILLSTFPCGPDSLANELIIRKVKEKPLISLIMDNQDETTGLITRLESFIDIIKSKKESSNK